MIGDGWQESVRWSYSPRATVVRRLAEVEAERLGELEPSDAHTPTAQGLGGRAAVARRAEGKTTIAVILYLRRALWLAGDALARRMRGAAPGEVDQLAAPVALEDLSAPFGWDSDQELGEFPGAHVRRARS